MDRTVLLIAVILVLAGCGEVEPSEPAAAHGVPRAVVADCSMRSEAPFPGAYTDPANLVEGPLSIVRGAAGTSARTVRAYGGDKFPLLVRAGRRVTVAVVGRGAALAYGPLPEGEIGLADAHRAVTFVACRGRAPTFWMGFVMARSPRCVPLDVWVGDDPLPRRVAMPLGARCPD